MQSGAANPSELTRKVAEVYLGSLMQPEGSGSTAGDPHAITLTAAQMEARAGTYVNEKDPGDVVRWFVSDRKLLVGNVGEDQTYEVRPAGENEFHLGVPTALVIFFLPAQPGKPLQFTLKQDGKVENTPQSRPSRQRRPISPNMRAPTAAGKSIRCSN